MGPLPKLWIVIVWCTVFSPRSVLSQGKFYLQNNVNQYKITNGRYQLVTPPPPPPPTTPEPTLMETIFPWMGNAYDSAKTPEEDAAILSSVSDNDVSSSNVAPVTESEGISSWFSLPGFGTSTSESAQTPNVAEPPIPAPAVPPMELFTNGNNMNFHNGPFLGAASLAQPMVVPPPDNNMPLGMYPPPDMQFGMHPPPDMQFGMHPPPDMQFGMHPPPDMQFGMYPPPDMPLGPYPPQEISSGPYPFPFPEQPPPQYPPPNFMHNMPQPFPVPPMNSPIYGQPMYPPYPYSAHGNYLDPSVSGQSPPEKSESILDMLSSYFSFSKRSDNFGDMYQEKMSRNLDAEAETESESGEDAAEENEGEDADAETEDDETQEKKAATEFSCPKTGLWKWNGEVCIAVGPVPVWACRPNDLLVSGKIAICRNKIYFSPKVLSRSTVQ